MKKPKLTPWYPPEIKPVRKGFYERKWNIRDNYGTFFRDRWDGQHWNWHGEMWEGPYSWRGLAEKP